MTQLLEVNVSIEPLSRFEGYVSEARMRTVEHVAAAVRERFRGRAMFHVSSTAVGGGVAEMLRSLLAYARGAGVDARWLVIEGDAPFFTITKRIHHGLHGSSGDGTPLDLGARAHYERVLAANARELLVHVRPRDVVVLHDPQTAGLAPALARAGALVVWRCHVGTGTRNEEVARAVDFLDPYLAYAPHHVFSREAYLQMGFRSAHAEVVHPSIDAFSPKNAPMEDPVIAGILLHTGIVTGTPPPGASTAFVRLDGTPSRVDRRAAIVRRGPPPGLEDPLVVQVSRWDPLKDPIGVLESFALAVAAYSGPARPHLVLAGPDVRGVTDDPEATSTLEATVAALDRASPEARARVSLVSLPVDDIDENAAIVNALQRHATVVVQKSLEEGFGLTVTEAMWKGRAIVASAVGGICDQIEDGVHGVLLDDPTNRTATAAALVRLLSDAGLRWRFGEAAHERARQDFLGIRHLVQFARLLLTAEASATPELAALAR